MQAGGADQTDDGKKKYDSVVYKRRIAMPLAQAEQFLAEETAGQKERLCRISPDSRQSQPVGNRPSTVHSIRNSQRNRSASKYRDRQKQSADPQRDPLLHAELPRSSSSSPSHLRARTGSRLFLQSCFSHRLPPPQTLPAM